VVGCCAHVASVLFRYLGYQRHIVQEVKPDRTDYGDFILDTDHQLVRKR